MPNKVVFRDRGLKAIVARLNRAGKTRLEVGLVGPAAEMGYPGRAGEVTVAEVGLINEFGSRHIPSRPFLRPVADGEQARRLLASAAERVVSEDPHDVLALLGEQLKSLVVAKILSHPPPPNAPATVKRKGEDASLLDLHMLVNAVSYRLVTNLGGGPQSDYASIEVTREPSQAEGAVLANLPAFHEF